MSFGLSYGSFGDLITTVQLVQRLVQSLSESRGSARELQSLIIELRLFQDVLQRLIFFWESRKQCLELQQLANIARPTIENCKSTIEAFLERALRKYGSSLSKGSRKTFWGALKAIQWNLCEVEDVEKLRQQLSSCVGILQMVQTRAEGIAQNEDHAAVSDKIVALMDYEKQADAKIEASFAKLMLDLENGANSLSRLENVANNIFSSMLLISNNILAIQSKIFNMEQIILMLPGMMSRLTLFQHNIAYIEDARGWRLPILMDAHPSWETVHSIILDQAVRYSSPGLELIRSKRYALQDNTSRRDVDPTLPFYQAAHPGQVYPLWILFNGEWNSEQNTPQNDQESICPKCRKVNTVVDPDCDITCANARCGFIYCRVVDVSHVDEKSLQESRKDLSKPQLISKDKDDEEDDYNVRTESKQWNDGSQGDDIDMILANSLPTRKGLVDGPDVFKRVRFLTTLEDRSESRGILIAKAGDFRFWDTSEDYMIQAELYMHVSILVHLMPYWDWIDPTGSIEDIADYWFIGFVGRTKEQSSPALIITAESRRSRRRMSRLIKRIKWLGAGSRFSILSAPQSAVIGLSERSTELHRLRAIRGTAHSEFLKQWRMQMRLLAL